MYRAVDQHGQVIDVLLTEQRDTAAARRFFLQAPQHGPAPAEVATDKAPTHLRVLDEFIPTALHIPSSTPTTVPKPTMAGSHPGSDRSAASNAPDQPRSPPPGMPSHNNLRRGHYELATDVPPLHRLTAALTEISLAV